MIGAATSALLKAIKIIGGTTDTVIGNIGDRLKVDTIITPSSGTIPSVGSKLRYIDINATTGGVARDTIIPITWTQVFSYTGTGLVMGVVLNIEEKNKWRIRFVVDGEELFGADGILTGDLIDDAVYDLDDGGSPLSTSEGRLGISMEEHDRFVWTPTSNFPVRYSSSVKIFLRRTDTGKKLKAGLMVMTQET